MAKRLIRLLATSFSLMFLLSGCLRMTTVASVSSEGTITGKMTYQTTRQNFDAVNYEVGQYLNSENLDRIDVVDVEYESLENCEVAEITFFLEQVAPQTPYISFSFITEETENSLFVTGLVTNSGESAGRGFLTVDEGVVIPASGDISDCQNLATVSSGKILAPSSPLTSGPLFGNIVDVRDSDSMEFEVTTGLALEQIANIPDEDMGLFYLFAENVALINQTSWVESEAPELKACLTGTQSDAFNLMNFRELESGEFASLMDGLKGMKITIGESAFSVECSFENLNLELFDRGANEDPEVQASPNDEGIWLANDAETVWHFEMDTSQNLDYDQAIANPDLNVIELSQGNNYVGIQDTAYQVLSSTRISNTYTIEGVVLSTNGSFTRANKVKFENAGWYSDESDYYYLKGFKPRNYELNAVLGITIGFKKNSKILSSSAKYITRIANSIKTSTKPDKAISLRLVGIYDGEVKGRANIRANEKLVSSRLSLVKSMLKAQLKKIGLRTSFVLDFVTDQSSSGDKLAKNKVVVQIN